MNNNLPPLLPTPTYPPVNESLLLTQKNSQIKDGSGQLLSQSYIDERRAKGLCFKCDEKYTFGHKCKNQLYLIQSMERKEEKGEENLELGEYKDAPIRQTEEDENPQISLQALTGLPSFNTMTVEGVVNKKSISILIDSESTHNFMDPQIANIAHCMALDYPLIPEDGINHALVSSTGIFETKGHDIVAVCAEVSDKDSLFFIIFGHLDLMVPRKNIQKAHLQRPLRRQKNCRIELESCN
ncbi:hypothetical protein AXF42_Ash009857 [Apostasia shenzhenica]|uniref:Uncharacterized protein n=1 Tax=Apostasia shenzhenica TaxID=1088818 RepID=A0A2I0AXA0_9ASPA|nr:hypothetical protein AXF42_Ash009857 [Apostasia shenzhenica]